MQGTYSLRAGSTHPSLLQELDTTTTQGWARVRGGRLAKGPGSPWMFQVR